MKKSFLVLLVFLCTKVLATEGYKDIYIKSDKDIYVHTIYCANDLSNLNKLRPSVVYTNTKSIENGTYYINARGTKYSTTFNKIDGQSSSIRVRGILQNGKTLKSQMEKQLCIVEKNPGLPKALNAKIATDILKSNDSNWNQKMKQFTNYFGQPASENGKYMSQK
ncbi:hypothetical protein OAR97_07900 [Arcobacteraceae bacterium]|nr:hypothetical protein [Arcobacteraceae bacterium]